MAVRAILMPLLRRHELSKQSLSNANAGVGDAAGQTSVIVSRNDVALAAGLVVAFSGDASAHSVGTSDSSADGCGETDCCGGGACGSSASTTNASAAQVEVASLVSSHQQHRHALGANVPNPLQPPASAALLEVCVCVCVC
jgi:hypothetical protein